MSGTFSGAETAPIVQIWTMRKVGSLLMALGVLIGGGVGIAMILGLRLTTVPWIVAVGLGKLVFFSGVGFIGAGATLHRIAKRQDDRLKAPPDAT